MSSHAPHYRSRLHGALALGELVFHAAARNAPAQPRQRADGAGDAGAPDPDLRGRLLLHVRPDRDPRGGDPGRFRPLHHVGRVPVHDARQGDGRGRGGRGRGLADHEARAHEQRRRRRRCGAVVALHLDAVDGGRPARRARRVAPHRDLRSRRGRGDVRAGLVRRRGGGLAALRVEGMAAQRGGDREDGLFPRQHDCFGEDVRGQPDDAADARPVRLEPPVPHHRPMPRLRLRQL